MTILGLSSHNVVLNRMAALSSSPRFSSNVDKHFKGALAKNTSGELAGRVTFVRTARHGRPPIDVTVEPSCGPSNSDLRVTVHTRGKGLGHDDFGVSRVFEGRLGSMRQTFGPMLPPVERRELTHSLVTSALRGRSTPRSRTKPGNKGNPVQPTPPES